MTRVKICGITRIEDALAAAELGADAVGLVFFEKSPRHLSLGQGRAIVRALPPFVTTVALFVDPTPEEVEAVLEAVEPDLLQFHGNETPAFCGQFHRPYLKAVRVRPGTDLLQYAAAYADARGLLLDAYVEGVEGGTGHRFDWDLIPGSLPKPVVLAGGLTPQNVAQAIRRVRPWAVDVSSGVEADEGHGTRKGVKDAAKIAAFIRESRNADV